MQTVRRDVRVRVMTMKHIPLFVAVGVLLLNMVVLGFFATPGGLSEVVYTLDDPYIHMAIAKNVSEHGVWGITPHEPTRTSSSMLWTLLLSGVYCLTGPNLAAPLIMNLLASVALLLVCESVFLRLNWGSMSRTLALLAVVFVTPLAPIAFCGMEHLLQALLAVLFCFFAVKPMTRPADERLGLGRASLLCLFGLLLVMARYEDAFLVAVVCVMLLVRGRWLLACVLGAVSASPVIIAGIIWKASGWFFLPNSVLLKGQSPSWKSMQGITDLLGRTAFLEIARNPFLLMLIILSVVALVWTCLRYRTFWRAGVLWNMMFLGGVLLHMQFAKSGWFFRYEAYLMTLGTVGVLFALGDLPAGTLRSAWPRSRAARVGVVLVLGYLLMPIVGRALVAQAYVPRAVRSINDQQIQMARFLRDHFPAETAVAANDIGAICYFADIRCLDLWGLANRDVLALRQKKSYGPDSMAELASKQGVQIAMVYECWYQQFGGLPQSWVRVARWRSPRTLSLGHDTVSIFATDKRNADKIRDELKAFEKQLPKSVTVLYDELPGRPVSSLEATNQ